MITPVTALANDPPPVNKFLKLGEGERYWYLEGAVATVAHLIATQNQQKGDCAATWYLRDRDAKRKLIEDSLAQNPTELPTTIILGLLTRACGPLLSQ